MEIALPLVALSGLYLINNQSKKKSGYESFSNRESLPNTDIPNKNYPEEYPVLSSELDLTSSLSHNNNFDSPGVYTDKYFNPYANQKITEAQGVPSYRDNMITTSSYTQGTPAKYTSLDGSQVDSTYFQHNNMVPFFGSSLRTNHNSSNSNESVLDNMNGSGSQIYSKKEQAPMFSPHDSIQWAYGAPNVNDFYQSRVNPSMKMANVKPFAEERVGPGLGLGYTTEGGGGFNSGMAMRDSWLDRGVDELRVANKPKSSGHLLFGHEGPANSAIKYNGTIEQMGVMEKNRPERAFEMGHERLFTTTGVEKGPMLQGIPVERPQARTETTTSYSGGAMSSNPEMYVTGEYMPSQNIQLGELPIGIANANGRYYANSGDYGIQSNRAYPNNRSENEGGDYFGIMGGAIGSVVAPLLDALRPSRRENTIGNLRPYQNAKTTVANSYIFNPADRTPTTIRETTENSKFHLIVNANQRGGAYKVTDQQAIDNNRMTTGDFYYAGGSSAITKEARVYDNAYNQRNNEIKSSTNVGYTTGGGMATLNNYINQRSADKDSYLKNTREVAPQMPYETPNITGFGKLQGTNPVYQNIQLDRNDGSVLTSLKGNPYALSVTGGI
jgi:hypothetical protein